jgi:hypothetical protein
MTDKLTELRRLLEASTPGPWLVERNRREDSDIITSYSDQSYPTGIQVCRTFNTDSALCRDSALIASLRNNAAALLAVAEAARKMLHSIRLTDFYYGASAQSVEKALAALEGGGE